jgi:hypothetical protein
MGQAHGHPRSAWRPLRRELIRIREQIRKAVQTGGRGTRSANQSDFDPEIRAGCRFIHVFCHFCPLLRAPPRNTLPAQSIFHLIAGARSEEARDKPIRKATRGKGCSYQRNSSDLHEVSQKSRWRSQGGC